MVLDALTDFRVSQTQVNQQVMERLDRADQRFEQIDRRFEQVDQRAERMNQRIERMDLHIGYLRGAHAINAAERNASLIADDMGYQLISLVPRDVLIGFANMARDAGKAEDDVRSFREADLGSVDI